MATASTSCTAGRRWRGLLAVALLVVQTGGVAQPGAAATRPRRTPSIATYAKVRVRSPAGVPRLVGFHEASSRGARRMRPSGRLIANHNGKYRPPRRSVGASYRVMPSRRRGTPATSAVDVAMRSTAPVRSAVTGRVSYVGGYRLYGRHRDMIVVIVPRRRPSLRVVMLHIRDVRVRPGQRVAAGRTRVATRARRLPFTSQIDTWTGRAPHVHIEVRRS
ncbi:MAG: M23 family metallopeptidase [Actinomycetota bacterium]|nr:M23 family metallopeptidase [Actinomycetota bacterium]